METLHNRRNSDFMEAFKQATTRLMKSGEPTVDEVIGELLDGDAPAFYVSFEYAYNKICQIVKGKCRLANTRRSIMWLDLAREVRRVISLKHPITIADALMDVLETSRAPSFYLSHESARRLYYKILQKRRTSHRLNRRSLF